MGCSGLKEVKGLETIASLRLLKLGRGFPVFIGAELRSKTGLTIEQHT